MLGQEPGGRRCDLPKWYSRCVVAGYSVRSREGTQVGGFPLRPALERTRAHHCEYMETLDQAEVVTGSF